MGMKMRNRLAALLLAALMLLAAVPMGALAAPPAGDEDYAYMHSYVSKTDTPGVYKVTMEAEFKMTPVRPPALVTLVLDGTASMNSTDVVNSGGGANLARDAAVRQAAIAAIDELMTMDNTDRIFVNVVMFGSYQNAGISLTEWATRSSKGPSDTSTVANWNNKWMPGIPFGNAVGSANDNTATIDGTPFVPLTDVDGGQLNPVLAGLFNHDIIGDPAYDPAFASKANAIQSVYYYGAVGRSDPHIRFPLSWSGTYIGPGVQLAYEQLDAKISAIKADTSNYSALEFDAMTKGVLIMADGDDSRIGVTQSWAAALKAPYDDTTPVNIPVANMANTAIGQPAPDTRLSSNAATVNKTGLGAQVWSLVVGTSLDDPQESSWATPATYAVSGFNAFNRIGKPMASLVIPITSQADADNFSTGAYAMGTELDWSHTHPYYNAYTPLLGNVDANVQARYRRALNTNAAESFFTAFANSANPTGGTIGAVADLKLSSFFDVYQMPGKPLLHTWSTDAGTNPTATYKDGRIDWDLGPLSDGTTKLEFYVKIADGLDNSLYYQIFDSCTLSYTMSPSGSNQSYTINFPMPYVSPGGGVKQEEGKEVSLGDGTGKTDGYTGMDQHRDNRDSAKSTVETLSYRADIAPIIKGVKAGTAANGQAKAIVDVDNGNLMRYQWEYRVEKGKDVWEDIPFANRSQYILAWSRFKAGETYDLRCKITNPAGITTTTEIIQVKAAKANAGKLQSK